MQPVKDTVDTVVLPAVPHLGQLFLVTADAPWVEGGGRGLTAQRLRILNLKRFILFAVKFDRSRTPHPKPAVKRGGINHRLTRV